MKMIYEMFINELIAADFQIYLKFMSVTFDVFMRSELYSLQPAHSVAFGESS